MMLIKKSAKHIALASVIGVFFSSPLYAQDSKIASLKDSIQESKGTEYLTEQEFKKELESLKRQKELLKRKAELKELTGDSEDENGDGGNSEEQSIAEKLNPPKDARQVSIEFFDLMEKEYQDHLYQLRNEIDALKDAIKSLKDPNNPEVIQNHIYPIEIYSFGNNRYATIMWNFHTFEKVTEGEEVVPGAIVTKIGEQGVEITKNNGEKHFIYKVSKRRAIENSWAAKKDANLKYLGQKNEASGPGDIDIRPPMGMGGSANTGIGGVPPVGGLPSMGSNGQLPIIETGQ